MTNFSRAKLRGVEQEEPGEIQIVPAPVVETKALLCAARLENSLDHNEFKALVDEFEESVRHDERERQKAIAVMGKAIAARNEPPAERLKFMDAAGEAEIRKRLEGAPLSATGKLKQGWAAAVGAELGYTVTQIQACVHKIKHGRNRA